MTHGTLATSTVSLSPGGSTTVQPSDFTGSDGDTLSDGTDAVVVRAMYGDGSITVERRGDADGNGTFDITLPLFQTEASGLHVKTDLTIVVLEDAGVQITNDGGGTKQVTLAGEVYPAASFWTEQDATLTDTSILERAVASHNSEETVLEYGSDDDSTARLFIDHDDDATFETQGIVTRLRGSGTRHVWIPLVDHNSSNPMMKFGVRNGSGSDSQAFILGSIGGQL